MAKKKQKTPVAPAAETAEEGGSHSDENVAKPPETGAEATAEAPKLSNKERKALMMAEKKQKGSAKQQRADKREAKRTAVAKKSSSSDDDDDDRSAKDSGDASGADEEVVVTRQGPVDVLYCPVCTFPAEMCEFSGMMEQCRPWLQEHAAELADAEERGRKRRMLTEKERLQALVDGRGVKKAIQRSVVIEVVQRTRSRKSTLVTGLDLFGVNLKDTANDWRKAFACGAGVHAAEEGKHQDSIDLQGEFTERLANMLVDKYGIPSDAIFVVVNKKKVPFF